jgi:catechol 2,3-dioxygenase-like lactoylglutathione lyase family enzyme
MAILDIGHPAFGCHDLDAALTFYGLFGIKESFRLLKDDGTVRLVYLHVAGDRFLELFPGGPAPDNRAPTAQQSYRHLCLITDDIEGMVEHLRSHGITIDTEPKVGLDFNTQAWVKDPDGNPIELMQLALESPQRAIADGTAFPESKILVQPDSRS